MTLAEIKQLVSEGKKSKKFSSLDLAVYELLADTKSVEDIVCELSDEDLSEGQLQDLFGTETEELIVQLTIEQASFMMATWLLQNSEVSEFNKEELAYVFTHDYPLEVESGSELFVTLYIQGFLTDKEKQSLLPKVNQTALLQLAVYETEQGNGLSLVKQLDKLNSSLYMQHHELKTIPEDIYAYLKDAGKLNGRNAISALTKVRNLSAIEQNFLITQALEDSDNDMSYYLFTQFEISDKALKNKVIQQALHSDAFIFNSLPQRQSTEVEESVLSLGLYHLEDSAKEKKLIFQKRELAVYNKDTKEVIYNSYLSQEAVQIINNQFNQGLVELPELIKGVYNLHKETFTPNDTSLGLTLKGLRYSLVPPQDYVLEGLKLWKPNLAVPAVLQKISEKQEYKLTMNPEELSQVPRMSAKSLEDLQSQIKMRIKQLSEQLNIPPMNPKRPFGVEIELCMKGVRPSDLALTLEGDDLYDLEDRQQVNSSVKSAAKNWAIKFDASVKHLDKDGKALPEISHLEEDRFTAEIVTPKMYGEEGIQELRNKLGTLMDEYGDYLSVNISCGLHVHHDINDLFELTSSVKQKAQGGLNQDVIEWLQSELAKVQESVYSLCSKDRRTNVYCPRLVVKGGVKTPPIDYKVDEESINCPRPGFNLSTGYGTIEFRMHEATLDIDQIVNWVKATHFLIEQVINKILSSRNTAINQLQETLKLMEIEKLKKVQNETDLETALNEINEFIKNNYWSKQFSQF